MPDIFPETAVRWARPDDAADIIRLVKDLAIYEKEPVETVKVTEDDIRRDGFGPSPKFECLIAEMAGEAVGFALFFANYSTWEGRSGLYLEDLFVEERARGTGLGKALMVALAKLAEERDCGRIDLSVLDWNPTRDFYDALGFRHNHEWLSYRLDGVAITELAAKAPAIGV